MNFIYDTFAEAILGGQLTWEYAESAQFYERSIHYKAQLVDPALYTPDVGHNWLSDIPEAARVGYSVGLTGLEPTDGYLWANPVTFIGLELVDPVAGLVIYHATGIAGSSRLVAWVDDADGLPVTPDGLDVIVTWPNRQVGRI